MGDVPATPHPTPDFVFLFIYLFVCLFVCLFICLFVCLFVYFYLVLTSRNQAGFSSAPSHPQPLKVLVLAKPEHFGYRVTMEHSAKLHRKSFGSNSITKTAEEFQTTIYALDQPLRLTHTSVPVDHQHFLKTQKLQKRVFLGLPPFSFTLLELFIVK